MKKILIFLCFFTAAAFILTSCKDKYNAKLDKTYEDSQSGFSVSYPSEWVHTEYEPYVVFFQAPERNNFNAALGIITDTADPSYDNMTKEQFLKKAAKDLKDFKLLEFQRITFAGEKCIMAVFDSTGDFGRTRQKEYLLNHNGKLFTLLFTSLAGDYGYYTEIFDKIAQSFAFTSIGG